MTPLMMCCCLLAGFSSVQSHQNQKSSRNFNHLDDNESHMAEAIDIGSWSLNDKPSSVDDGQYKWLDDDLVLKNRREPDGLIRLPGGCEMTQAQYKKLQQFRRDVDYVQNCYCQDSSVYCKLRKGDDHVHIT